jgi:Dolichyl-phosphate-mannose-protein mannosyltransferase
MTVHAGLLLVGIRWNFAVFDEGAHVPAGISHWQTGDFSLYRVNPPLGRMLAALPVLLVRPHSTYVHVNHQPGGRADWDVGRDFAELNAPRYFDLICLARLPGVLWSLLGAWIINRWCRELYGGWAGCLGVALWVFDPAVLAFAQVVTPDIPAAVAGILATYVFWRYLRSGSWALASWSGLLLGVAQLTKFTMVVLYGVWPLIALAYYLRREEGHEAAAPRAGTRENGPDGACTDPDAGQEEASSARSVHFKEGRAASAWGRRALQALAIVLISLDAINLGYFFQDTCWQLGDFTFVSRSLTGTSSVPRFGEPANRFRSGWLGRLVVPLPAEYLQGIDAQRRDFESEYPSYLAGEWRNRGWWYYYLYALAVKEPLGTLTLIVWGLVLTITRHPSSARWEDELTLWLPAAVVLILVSSQTGFNHHMRYVLPAFPFVAVAPGKLGYFLRPGRPWSRLVILALLGWAVASSVRVCPHSMSYFNEVAGGPENGHNHLVDSNIDWGQDLLALRDWIREHPEARPFGLAYFHFLDPGLLGIEYQLPPLGPEGELKLATEEPEHLAQPGPRPGYYALSVNYLRGVTFNAPNGRGGWTWINRHDAFAYFQHFRPIARAGYSIYIYHITPEEADSVRHQLGLPALARANAAPSDRAPRFESEDDQ